MSRFVDKVKQTAKKIMDEEGFREGLVLITTTVAGLLIAILKRK